jgi:hypothetical protein
VPNDCLKNIAILTASRECHRINFARRTSSFLERSEAIYVANVPRVLHLPIYDYLENKMAALQAASDVNNPDDEYIYLRWQLIILGELEYI